MKIFVPVATAGDGACGIHSTWCTGSRWNRAKGRNELFCANARSNAKNALEQISQNTMSHTATLVCTELWNDGGKTFFKDLCLQQQKQRLDHNLNSQSLQELREVHHIIGAAARKLMSNDMFDGIIHDVATSTAVEDQYEECQQQIGKKVSRLIHM